MSVNMKKIEKQKLEKMVSDFVTQGITETEGPGELMTVFLHCIFAAASVGEVDAEEVAESILDIISNKKFIAAMNRTTFKVEMVTVQ